MARPRHAAASPPGAGRRGRTLRGRGKTATAYVGIGSNLRDPVAQVERALRWLERLGLVRASSLYAAEPLGPPDQPWYTNAVAELHTALRPAQLLRRLRRLEWRAGRRPGVRWGPRILDLDLLLYADLQIRGAHLVLPHPGLGERRFVLAPLAEIAPDVLDPRSGRSVAQLLAELGDPLRVERLAPRALPGVGGAWHNVRRARSASPDRGWLHGVLERFSASSTEGKGRVPAMKFFLDTAHIPHLREAAEAGLIDGVTTNPSLLSKEQGDPREIVREIAKIVDGPISAEVVSLETEGMVREGLAWRSVADNIVVKIPMTLPGLKAIRALTEQGVPTNCTLIFSPMQALMAAKAGASMVSPFVGRLDDIQTSGMDVIQQIVEIFSNYDISAEVLVASIRGPLHAVEAARLGADIATMPWSVLQSLAQHPLTDIGIEKFLADWERTRKQ